MIGIIMATHVGTVQAGNFSVAVGAALPPASGSSMFVQADDLEPAAVSRILHSAADTGFRRVGFWSVLDHSPHRRGGFDSMVEGIQIFLRERPDTEMEVMYAAANARDARIFRSQMRLAIDPPEPGIWDVVGMEETAFYHKGTWGSLTGTWKLDGGLFKYGVSYNPARTDTGNYEARLSVYLNDTQLDPEGITLEGNPPQHRWHGEERIALYVGPRDGSFLVRMFLTGITDPDTGDSLLARYEAKVDIERGPIARSRAEIYKPDAPAGGPVRIIPE